MKWLRSFNYIFLCLAVLSVTACSTGSNKTDVISDSADSSVIVYAKGFSIRYFSDYTQVIVNNPWKSGSIYATYFLVKDTQTEVPEGGVKILVPLKTIAPASVTHYEFLHLLGELNTVTGICQADIVYNKKIKKGIEEGRITDLGDAFHINVEKVLQLSPSALMMSGYNQKDANLQRISQAGIPVIYNNEWMETSLLGRAEWIKFVAAFYDKSQLADSVFSNIENRYNDIKQKVTNIKDKPGIMAGSNFRGTWYMPAGRSFMGQLFADAGSRYFYSNDTTTGSLPLNVEKVLRDFSDADIWLNCNFATLDELIKSDSKHALFKPVQTRQVYNFNKRMLPSGANDFWESAVARPDLLLSDVIAVLHPEILPDYELVYAEKLK
jgi:iron complex transport system substrate-binding protein